jgi:hypothetical protein
VRRSVSMAVSEVTEGSMHMCIICSTNTSGQTGVSEAP